MLYRSFEAAGFALIPPGKLTGRNNDGVRIVEQVVVLQERPYNSVRTASPFALRS